ncbi:ABC transporter permease [uncultured Massilia sp.]|uniref:ABC transporter permease n=1 Tax=uncultured Massilia sp. TaxID=169973 RepID=UPI0025CFC11C|nr:FtsX-like permease family protein [uncultured Massilia sp.]
MEIRPILSALLRNKTGPILVALQVAISLAILANTAHIVEERRDVVSRPSGLSDESATFYFTVRPLGAETPEKRLADIKRQADLLRAVGGVAAVAQVSQMPLSQSGWISSVFLNPSQEKSSAEASIYQSGDSLVKTFGLRVVDGRDFLSSEFVDVNDNVENVPAQVVIISKPLAERLWPGESAVGKTLYMGDGPGASGSRVVGVVERLMSAHGETSERGLQTVIVPHRSYGDSGALFAVRAEAGQRDRVMKEAEAALRKSSALPLIMNQSTVDGDRQRRYRNDVALQWMLVTVSVLLLLITCSGIVGMASLWVTQRRKQIGVRRALGARKVDILRHFITENFMITSAGVFGGVVLGLALNHLLVSQLELARLPAGYLLAGAAVFWVLGVLAAYGPAWRAASISPATATRSV